MDGFHEKVSFSSDQKDEKEPGREGLEEPAACAKALGWGQTCMKQRRNSQGARRAISQDKKGRHRQGM